MLLQLDEQQADGGPDDFAQADEQGHEDALAGADAQALGRKQEASFAPAQLEGNEEEHVGKERGEGQDEDALQVVGRGHDDQQDEEYFEGRHHAARQFQDDGGEEGARILTVKGRYLLVDGAQLLGMALKEALGPFLDEGYVAEDAHAADGNAPLVALEEEPDGGEAEGSNAEQEDAHGNVHGLGDDIERAGEEPEPEVGEDVGHDVEHH